MPTTANVDAGNSKDLARWLIVQIGLISLNVTMPRRRLCKSAPRRARRLDLEHGSAGWMQRAGIESILGLRLRGEVLHLDPCIPKSWPRFEMMVRYRSARYQILVENPDGAGRGIASAQLDDTSDRGAAVACASDGRRHHTSSTGSVGVIAARDLGQTLCRSELHWQHNPRLLWEPVDLVYVKEVPRSSL